MKQYSYQIIHRATGRVEHARATAATPDIARAQIVLAYGPQFDVMGHFSDINPAHRILGEIDCSDFPESDTDWLISEAAAIEAATI
jgi:hypothetical protein